MSAGEDNQFGHNTAHTDGEALVPFDVREQTGRRSIMVLAVFIIGLLLLALIVFFTYQPGTRDRDVAPRISADNAPFKVTPENPGGTQTPDQDKAVYDVMAGKDVTETVTPAPGAEVPINMPRSANIQVDAPKTVTNAPVVAPRPTARPKPAPRPVTAPVATGSGDYVVQVASVRNRGDAVDLWSTVSNKFSSVLPSGLYSDIKQVDLGDKGIYYRLRVAGLADKTAATKLCNQFKARGQACLVAKR